MKVITNVFHWKTLLQENATFGWLGTSRVMINVSVVCAITADQQGSSPYINHLRKPNAAVFKVKYESFTREDVCATVGAYEMTVYSMFFEHRNISCEWVKLWLSNCNLTYNIY